MNDVFHQFVPLSNPYQPTAVIWDELLSLFQQHNTTSATTLKAALSILCALTTNAAAASECLPFQQAVLIFPLANGPQAVDAKVIVVADQIVWSLNPSNKQASICQSNISRSSTSNQGSDEVDIDNKNNKSNTNKRLVRVNIRTRKRQPWTSSTNMFTLLSDDEALPTTPCKRRYKSVP